ncbi:MAG: four helix bundle protein [Planctomycetota bacterium]
MAIEFVAWSECLLESCRGKATSAKQHLEEASARIPNNIAEGNGKWSKKDRKRFFEISRGSALECASCLDILVARKRVERPQIAAGTEKLHGVVNRLTRMIKNLSTDES